MKSKFHCPHPPRALQANSGIRALSGPVFQFLIGENAKTMLVHAGIVTIQSQALRALVEGPMEEGQAGCVVWKDVEESTFNMFAQFMYTGDYSPPLHSYDKDADDTAIKFLAEFKPESDESDDGVRPRIRIVKHPRKRASTKIPGPAQSDDDEESEPLTKRFEDLIFPIPTKAELVRNQRANMVPSEDYTPVLLGHARLYVFANKYCVEVLEALALSKFHETLRSFTLYEARYEDLQELIVYVYENTVSYTVVNPLRDMAVRYVAYEAKAWMTSKPGITTLEECGGFAVDLVAVLLERLS